LLGIGAAVEALAGSEVARWLFGILSVGQIMLLAAFLACTFGACGVKSVVALYSAAGITFCRIPYETFDRSCDVF
jgi:hypothetical protein